MGLIMLCRTNNEDLRTSARISLNHFFESEQHFRAFIFSNAHRSLRHILLRVGRLRRRTSA